MKHRKPNKRTPMMVNAIGPLTVFAELQLWVEWEKGGRDGKIEVAPVWAEFYTETEFQLRELVKKYLVAAGIRDA